MNKLDKIIIKSFDEFCQAMKIEPVRVWTDASGINPPAYQYGLADDEAMDAAEWAISILAGATIDGIVVDYNIWVEVLLLTLRDRPAVVEYFRNKTVFDRIINDAKGD